MIELHPIREWRITTGVKQWELARQVGVSTNMIHMIETYKKMPSFQLADKIREQTKLSLEQIFATQPERAS